MRRYLTIVIFLAVLCSMLVLELGRSVASRGNELIVKLAPGADIDSLVERYRLHLRASIDSNWYLLGSTDDQIVQRLSTDPEVVLVEQNATLQFESLRQPVNFPGDEVTIVGFDKKRFQQQPLADLLELDSVHGYSRGKGIKVAVIDTGIDLDHPALTGRITLDGYDFLDGDRVPMDEVGGSNYGHGTFISALILLIAPEAKIMPLRVMAPDGTGTAFHLAQAIRYAADHGAHVINLSLGADETMDVVKEAISYAIAKDCIITAAAGNSNSDAANVYPASDDQVLAVAATDHSDQKAYFSNFGGVVDLSATGTDLVSAFPGGLYARWGGTSFATAVVTAESALLRSFISRNVRELMLSEEALVELEDNRLGRGRIAPLQALRHADLRYAFYRHWH